VRASLALSFISPEKNMAKLTKLSKVNENISINRYDNGWMVEIGGRDKEEDWKNTKTLCNTEEELIALIKEYNAMDLDN
jgi:glycine cleavage system H lipoate-binding protein